MAPASPPFRVRQTWSNHLGNQRVDPLRVYEPRCVDDVVAIVALAEREGVGVRAVGSGHSWSDVALTEGFLLLTTGLQRVPAPEPDFLAPAWRERMLVRAEAGARIEQLNDHLDATGRGLVNMGGYDQQTIAGVISTSTHGSGLGFGPLDDAVRSLDVVSAGGTVRRIERSAGPTDRAAYEAHFGDRRTLVQDDATFDAVVVGIGCMGIVCSVLVEVRERFFLRERRVLRPWAQVREELLRGDALCDNAHYELLFSPYEHRVAQPFVVTTRNPIDGLSPRSYLRHTRWRNVLVERAASSRLTPPIINALLDARPQLAPAMLELALRSLVREEYDNVSFKVFNIGRANELPAYSSEIGVPLAGDRHVAAVEAIIRVAQRHRALGDVVQSSPIAIRFVRASSALLSMMHGRDTAMFELIGLRGNDGGYELLNAYEEQLYALGGRPHWGQVNTLTADLVAAMYPDTLDRWLAVHARLNASGVFDSPFSKRVGLSRERFAP